jgi:membrane-anchored glycerophosphoryl diester phosphodiesterase (GDPDase)
MQVIVNATVPMSAGTLILQTHATPVMKIVKTVSEELIVKVCITVLSVRLDSICTTQFVLIHVQLVMNPVQDQPVSMLPLKTARSYTSKTSPNSEPFMILTPVD